MTMIDQHMTIAVISRNDKFKFFDVYGLHLRTQLT